MASEIIRHSSSSSSLTPTPTPTQKLVPTSGTTATTSTTSTTATTTIKSDGLKTMATLDYVHIPSCAIRLKSQPVTNTNPTSTSNSNSKGSDIEIEKKSSITNLPNPTTSSSYSRLRSSSTGGSGGGGMGGLWANQALSFIPQLLMGPIPTSPSATNGASGSGTGTNASAGTGSTAISPMSPTNPNFNAKLVRGQQQENVKLLSNNVPLSLPIMTNNFKRFVARVGPVFWFQDRVEEILFWKRGWLRTLWWMCVYTFLCYFPRMIFLIPHIAIIAIILSTYPYPSTTDSSSSSSTSTSYSFSSSSSTTTTPSPPPTAATEGTIAWQANIQGLQNLMGLVSDVSATITPYTYHLSLTPAHLMIHSSSSSTSASTSTSTSGSSSTSTSTAASASTSTGTKSPYTPHILTFLSISFIPLTILVHTSWFPIREIILVGGLLPFLITNPSLQVLGLYLWYNWSWSWSWSVGVNVESSWMGRVKKVVEWIVGKGMGIGKGLDLDLDLPIKCVLERVLDNDRLNDECWNSEMREVELFENERFDENENSNGNGSNNGSGDTNGNGNKGGGWSKKNLKSGERVGWTRGRDGWSGVGPNEQISNLTFSLGPGWSFVETEDWRKDLKMEWVYVDISHISDNNSDGNGNDNVGVGDGDGWVYTNDSWLNPSKVQFRGGVTRRRRWVRRVWFDVRKVEDRSV